MHEYSERHLYIVPLVIQDVQMHLKVEYVFLADFLIQMRASSVNQVSVLMARNFLALFPSSFWIPSLR